MLFLLLIQSTLCENKIMEIPGAKFWLRALLSLTLYGSQGNFRDFRKFSEFAET